MNSCYSNRIEGQSTHPLFSSRPAVARLQRIALAHIEAERELEQANGPPLQAPFLLDALNALFPNLYPEVSLPVAER